MEFRFNVNEVFKQPIVEISSSLIPPGLSLADKRALWDAVGKVSDVVNAMGEASATAQGLSKPITTSERLRNSEHKLYLLIDQNTNNGKGAVTGMLKTGKKGLYVFDRDGHHFQVQPACVLDFYIHESKQRMGLGKKLYEHMLEKEQVEPVKMAIDRPSDKFLGFLNKHYNLNSPVKQMNNFVVYDGFFPEHKDDVGENNNTGTGKSNQPANGLQTTFASPYGRYGAPRPPCSMGQIIHNQSALAQPSQEPGGTSLNIRAPTKTRSAYADRPQTNSEKNQQISQSTPNMWNQNQNASNAQIQGSQQMGGGYISQMTNMQSGMLMSPEDMNAQSQSNYVQPQIQQQQYQMEQQNMNSQQHNLQRQYQYNQNPYYQNQYTPQMQQNFTPQPYEGTQFDASQRNYIENQQQYRQTPLIQSQQYASDKALNTPATQPAIQTSDLQLQRKKSVQFTSTAQNVQPQPTHTQSAHDQKYVQRPQSGNQTTSAGNISQQQQSVKYSSESNSNQQYTQQAPYQVQSQQNSQPILNQPQNVRYAQNLQHPMQQPQQSQQTMYQPQQVQQQYPQQPPQMYPPQIYPQQSQQAIYQPQPSETMTYQSQQLQQAQNPITPEESAQRMKFEQRNVSQNVLGNHPGQYSSDPNQSQQIQQNYPNNQQQNINTENSAPGSIAQPLFNVPNNYQMAQTPMSNQYPSASVPNMMNYQQPQSPLIQNPQMPTQMHHSQPNIPAPQQMYSQTHQQFDPAVIPPMDAAYNPMNKSYQYYDSNAGRMQNTAGENLKQIIPGTQPAMTPNASGDNAETAEVVEAEQAPIVAPPPQPKLERPQSLSLQTSEDVEGDEEIKGEMRPQYVHTKSNFDIVEDIKKMSVAQNQATPMSKTPDKGDGDATRKTPSHLTEQGFFDLKFYHNKLW